LLALSIILTQLYSILNERAFWGDEWAILENIKYRGYRDLFKNLLNYQQFPRVYLTIIKYFSEMFNYNYLSLRTIPFTAQTVNILLSFYICKMIFEDSKYSNQKTYCLFLLFLSYPTSLTYYSQVKQYSMEIFLSILAIWQFLKLNSLHGKRLQTTWLYITINIIFLIGPFLSYTYAIVAAPIMLFFIITVVLEYDRHWFSNRYIIPSVNFSIACLFAYYIDVRHVLSDPYMSDYWSKHFVYLNDLKSVINSLYNLYLFLSLHMSADATKYSYYINYLIHVMKIITTILAMVGIVSSLQKILGKKRLRSSEIVSILAFGKNMTIHTYFVVLLIITLFLYLIKMLPLGNHRLNCFAVLMLSFFIVEGISYLLTHRAKEAVYFGRAIAPMLFLIIVVPIIYWNIHVVKMAKYGDQKQYINYSRAIEASYKENVPIMLLDNSDAEKLLKLNPRYLIDKPIRIYTIENKIKQKWIMLCLNRIWIKF